MKICMIWGGIGEGSVETSLLCFCMRWGHARIQEFLCQKTALTTFLVLNFTEGAQWLFQTKLYMYIFFFIFYFFFFFGGGVQMLISIETHTAYDFPGGSGPPTPSGSAHGETVRVHMPIF